MQQHRNTAAPRKNEKRKTFLPLFHFDSSSPIQNTPSISCIWTKRKQKLVPLPTVIFGLVVNIVFLTFIQDSLRWWYQTVAPGAYIAHGLSFTNMSLPTENNFLRNGNSRFKKGWLLGRRGANPPEIASNKYKTGGCTKNSTDQHRPLFLFKFLSFLQKHD